MIQRACIKTCFFLIFYTAIFSEFIDLARASTKAESALVVSRIIDGDTFELSGGIHVRLIGVDTPEKNEPFYREARILAESLLLGKQVVLEFDKEPEDRYGRRLAYLRFDTLFYNEYIVKRGLAYVYLFKNSLKHAGKLINAQKYARNQKAGLWSLEDFEPEPYYVSIKGSYRFHRPLCRAIKDAKKSKIIKIDSRNAAFDKGLSPCRQCRP